MDVGDKDEMTNFHQTTALNGHWTTITNLTEFLIFAMKREKLFQVHTTYTTKEFFRTCNVLPFSCTHLALWRGKAYKGKVKDPRYMQNKKDIRISLYTTLYISTCCILILNVWIFIIANVSNQGVYRKETRWAL